MSNRTETKDVICGDGMCPYVPCRHYPKCNHIKKGVDVEGVEFVKKN